MVSLAPVLTRHRPARTAAPPAPLGETALRRIAADLAALDARITELETPTC